MAGESRFVVGLFTHNSGAALREALKQQLQNVAGVLVVDYTDMEEELARKTINWVDIAILSGDSFDEPQIAARTAMLLEASDDGSNESVAFMTFYDDTNQAKVYAINEMLLAKKLGLLLTTRADEDDDFAIFALSVHSYLNGWAIRKA